MGEKTYIGEGRRVFVADGEGIGPLVHHVRHSPTGLNWGYGGSGPADLARSILIDHFGASDLHCAVCGEPWPQGQEPATPCAVCDADGAPEHTREFDLPVGYTAFKNEVIALLPWRGFILTAREIDEWIERHRAQRAHDAERRHA